MDKRTAQGLVKHRAIVRVPLAPASILILVGSIAFKRSHGGARRERGRHPVRLLAEWRCGQPGASESGALSIRTKQPGPVNVTARQMAVAGNHVSIGQQLGVPRDGTARSSQS